MSNHNSCANSRRASSAAEITTDDEDRSLTLIRSCKAVLCLLTTVPLYND